MYKDVQRLSCLPGGKVAIIGSACRFPGQSDSPELFFEQLLAGRTCVGPIPEARWAVEKFSNTREAAGKSYVTQGHFLEGYDFRTFDADFFRLSPREVEFLDPQQRLLLELAWEAMESAGLDVEALAGSRTGVFVGGFTVDHLLNQFGVGARDEIGSHSAAGATLTMLSNRISYAFDFCGPSLSIDTACSSSLVALAQGVTAIAAGQCEMALIGGANFMLRPEYSIAMSKGRFLAKDGRSKSFDARADGYGRGEGGGIVILKDYAAALRDGDDILAIIEGAGVNQDGRTSGITVPNPQAQRALMEDVLAASGCSADDVDYIEAHGTGTPVGDPRETSAIAQVYGRDGHCVVGSVKANIGHLEAAAGVASVIKSLMMLRHNQVPPVAALEQVNPNIPAEVSLPREVLPLGDPQQVRRIAINSFGYGGTNAHAILASAPAAATPAAAAQASEGECWLPLSARDGQALRERAGQLAQFLEGDSSACLNDVLFTLGHRRTHLDHRLLVRGHTRSELAQALRQAAQGEDSPALVQGRRPFNSDGRVAFVYTGMGPQWWAMGRELLRDSAVFRQTLEQADAAFTRIAGWSILEEMQRDEMHSQIKRTEFAQPANLMIQMGLTAMLKAEGLVADAVIGHSVGEVASGWASGMLSLEDALLVSRERSRIQALTAGTGGMLALGLAVEEAAELLAPYAEQVSFAAINSPAAVTLAGDRPALERIRLEAEARGVFARALDVEVPYHSPLMEPLKPLLREALATLQPQAPQLDLYSTVSGGRLGQEAGARRFDAEYWCDNVRNPVFFADAIGAMVDDGYSLFVEIGPHPVLRRSLEEIGTARGVELRTVATLWMNKPESPAIARACADIYTQGGLVDWALRTPQGRQVDLPAYPWQRQLLWRESHDQLRDRLQVQSAPLNADGEPADLNLQRLNYLFDHVVDGTPLMPAAGFLEALCEEGRRLWPTSQGLSLREVRIHQPLILDHARALRLGVEVDAMSQRARLFSRSNNESGAPLLHAEASLFPAAGLALAPRLPVVEGEAVDVLDLYAGLSRRSLQYGPAFQPIHALRRDRGAGLAEAHLQRPRTAGEAAGAYVLHPSLLDGCFQVALTLLSETDGAYLPVSMQALDVQASLPETIVCRASLASRSSAQIVCDFELLDTQGNLLVRIDGLLCLALNGGVRGDTYPAGDYQRQWQPLPAEQALAARPQQLLLVADRADALAETLVGLARNQGLAVEFCQWSQVAEHPCLGQVDRVIGLSLAGCGGDEDVTAEQTLAHMLVAVQALAAQGRAIPLRMLTRHAHALHDNEPVVPAQTAIAGFMRVVRNECANLQQTSIDIAEMGEAVIIPALVAAVFDEAMAERWVDEIALRDGQRYGARLIESGTLQSAGQVQAMASLPLELLRRGNAYEARMIGSAALAEDAYEIEVERLALDMGGDEQHPVGLVGTVLRAGRLASRFAVGERVVGLAPQRIASVLQLSEREALLEPAPSGRISPLGVTVEARVAQLARHCVALPGSRAMVVRGLLGDALSRRLEAAGMQVERVSADLADWSRAAGDGGFQLMAGPLPQWSRLTGFFPLAAGGQLIDLGRDPAPLVVPTRCKGLLRLCSNLDELLGDAQYRQALWETLAPLPQAPVFGFADLLGEEGPALGMADWVELEVQGDPRLFPAIAADRPSLRHDGVYLLSGGFGGLGGAVARWLAEHGAGHIALIGRRGEATPGARELLAELHDLGAEATALAVDVADAGAVSALVAGLHRPERPLCGIYHAAGVLEDHLLAQMTPQQLRQVMQPKAQGAWALHRAVEEQGIELEQFVLFSSIASLVGNSRQGNYCAANGFLEGLADERRRQGKAALSVNFGAIAGVGMLESDVRIGQHLTQIGLPPLAVPMALRGLGRALVRGLRHVAISEAAAWDRWAAYESVGGTCATFAELVAACRAAQGRDGSLVEQLHAALRELPESEALPILRELISAVVASALKTSPERLSSDQTFDSLGMDSLMSTEIKLQLEQKLGVVFSVMELMGITTIAKLAERALLLIQTSA
ncbi:acyl transferase domain-containing protein/NAD(P)-dependent dehydrogenase (short-subunit alcohol dehydrogenase family)/acyl carrier protein [Pseudomonas nitritireducens]|uniref:Acyl transferase domain-containing protein/NAD(P)-dependent dehydrogenase (Short-subunit alcohol dehydrogenase family)/acyl carrier protein n=1 Tax=Pseudomonas nitroreducens TaxID=46680 RepID=A0A7W7P0E1_PSENT|nr:type I polyketide synthase [Pseudomonas nitritireducens]MBB4862549.1 acyl transferase domain-containing protein/NAD(P)-dependent dehydrogenase (short-subunit alcohol dehydrogenase family)/acyl carrier protein [Pseudomonas nitritireducens]